MAALAAASIYLSSALLDDSRRNSFVEFMDARFGGQADAVEAAAGRAAGSVAGVARALRNKAQRLVVAVDRINRPENYEEAAFPASVEPLIQNAAVPPAAAPDRHAAVHRKPPKRSRRAVHRRSPKADPDPSTLFGPRRP
jgi:hypothetical protein